MVRVVQRIDTAERRRRIAVRHHLAPSFRADSVVHVSSGLAGLHATDPTSVYLGAFARTRQLGHDDLARALYDERSLLRILGMRRTMFVVPVELASIIHSAVTHEIGARERRRLLDWLAQAGVAQNVENWLADVETQTVQALEEVGEATASELSRLVPGLRVQIPFGAGKKWAGTVGVSTRMLFLLAAEGRIIRGRPKGTWVSSLYRWAPMDRWVEGGLEELPTEDAQAQLAARWLQVFGPATVKDLQWWTGWTLGATRRALTAVGAVDVQLDDGIGTCLPDDLGSTHDPGPWVALLPALDTTTMGWTERGWFLGTHKGDLFDTNGNAGPTVWADGRVLGGWAQRASGQVVYRLLEDVGAETEAAIGAEAARISAWLDGVRVIPRFRTPSEVELSA